MSELINILLLGSEKVGKTPITLQFVKGEYTESYVPTIDDEFVKSIEIDGKSYKIEVCDTAGQEDFKDLRARYIREAQCIIFVYSVDDVKSLNYLQEIYDDVISVKKTLPPTIMMGSRCDLPPPHAVTLEKARRFSTQHFQNIPVLEVSSATNQNITESFEMLIRIYLGKNKKSSDNDTNTTGGCCIIQ